VTAQPPPHKTLGMHQHGGYVAATGECSAGYCHCPSMLAPGNWRIWQKASKPFFASCDEIA